ncbi:MAG: PIG-L family deacetylase [Bacteroidota bacterium]|nr:PIG-L family deacetylase [Bacteroidota bacterium]
MKPFFFCLLLCFSFKCGFTQTTTGPKILIVTAHPDDETTFPVTIYKITHDLGGIADLALMTDGQGGFGNPELGSQYYGLNLQDSNIARAYLPAIRKRELMNSGKIMGIRNFFFFDQLDDYYSKDPLPYVNGIKWDIPLIEKKLDHILAQTAYDYVFVLLPTAEQHGHHKTASLMALHAVQRMKSNNKPIVLGGLEILKVDSATTHFEGLEGFPETKIKKGSPVFTFDRTIRFGFNNVISYMIVHDWTVAEYKSQGDTQNNYMHKYEMEMFWYFDINAAAGLEKVQKLFQRLKTTYPNNTEHN